MPCLPSAAFTSFMSHTLMLIRACCYPGGRCRASCVSVTFAAQAFAFRVFPRAEGQYRIIAWKTPGLKKGKAGKKKGGKKKKSK